MTGDPDPVPIVSDRLTAGGRADEDAGYEAGLRPRTLDEYIGQDATTPSGKIRAGRQLEREIGRVMRHAAMQVAEGTRTQVRVDAADLDAILGPPRFEHEIALRSSLPGVATGLAWTPVGGDILFIEATRTAGTGRLILTGQLGDVMKESAHIALSYVRSHAEALGVDPADLSKRVHVHVPAGAVPKDGPSAGITMTTALVSLLTGKVVKPTVGMTGEITLQGKVLPIGGVKQKVLAAHRAGLTEVVLPKRNGPDLDDVPDDVREAMTFHPVMTIGEVLELALDVAQAEAVAWPCGVRPAR